MFKGLFFLCFFLFAAAETRRRPDRFGSARHLGGIAMLVRWIWIIWHELYVVSLVW